MRYAENPTAAYFDNEAVRFSSQAAKWDKQADTARTDRTRTKYRAKAQELRNKAIEALENAKNSARLSAKGSR